MIYRISIIFYQYKYRIDHFDRYTALKARQSVHVKCQDNQYTSTSDNQYTAKSNVRQPVHCKVKRQTTSTLQSQT